MAGGPMPGSAPTFVFLNSRKELGDTTAGVLGPECQAEGTESGGLSPCSGVPAYWSREGSQFPAWDTVFRQQRHSKACTSTSGGWRACQRRRAGREESTDSTHQLHRVLLKKLVLGQA